MKSGPKYAVSKEGLVKAIVLVLGCTAFALFAASEAYDEIAVKEWVFAAYIISWSISLLFYFFHVIGLARRMNCGGGCSYDGFDFLWSWISTINFFAASVAFAVNITCDVSTNQPRCSLQAGSISLGFASFLAYAVEAFFLKSYAPANVGYIASPKGWFKTSILVGATATFSLLVDSGYNWCRTKTCIDAVTYSLVAFCIAWGVTLIIFFCNMLLPERITEKKAFRMFEFGWSCLSVMLFVSASSCFAAFMQCDNFQGAPCSKRLTGVLVGFITSILFAIDAFLERPKK